MEWEVWLADGRVVTSVTHTWDEVPPGVLIVRTWNPNAVDWENGNYGAPGTWKAAGWTDDATFARVLAEARAPRLPPSQRAC